MYDLVRWLGQNHTGGGNEDIDVKYFTAYTGMVAFLDYVKRRLGASAEMNTPREAITDPQAGSMAPQSLLGMVDKPTQRAIF